jgi:cytochrome c5
MRARSQEGCSVLKRLIPALLLPAAVVTQAIDLTEEQRAEIEARIAPVGEVCLQGENCGGLPAAASAASSAPAAAAAPAPKVAEAVAEAAEAVDEAVDAAEAADGDAAAEAVAAIDGQAVYNQACMACHMTGAAGAPIVGNAEQWAPRIAKGIDALHSSGINGVAGTGMMAKGGRADLSDAAVIAAVDYMVANSQ